MSTAVRQHLSSRVLDARRRAADRRAVPANPGDRGFVLLEEIVSITLLMVVMAALATFFITVTQSTTYERARQSAVQLANTETDAVDAVSAGDLYQGRNAGAVNAQFTTPAAQSSAIAPALATMDRAVDTNVLTMNATPTLAMTAAGVPKLNNVVYTVTNYLGLCSIPATAALGTSCVPTSTAPPLSTPYVRAVVTVTWPGSHCPQVNGSGLCTYVTSSLISATGDPTFNLCTLGAACGPAPPQLINPGAQFSVVNTTASLQLKLAPYTGVAPITWSATGLPSWLTLNTNTGLITGTAPATPAAPVTVVVTATDAFARTTQAVFTWTVVNPPTITGLVNPYTATAGLPIPSQTLPYTCPTSSCTYTLAGAPSGIGLAASSGGPGAATQTVTNTSGNLYLVGTVAATAAASTTAYPNDVASQKASNYWRLDETSGTTGADSIGGNNLIEQPGVTHGAAGGIATNSDTASTFDGASDGSAATTNPITAPNTFSESIWFRTTTTSGGKLLGFGNAATGTSNSYDRQVSMDNAGHLDFGVYNGSTNVVATPSTYNDGKWHQAVATLSPTAGMALFVDGVNVGSNPAVTSAQYILGYWRLGGDNLAGWLPQPSSYYFAGTLDDVSIYPSALAAAQVQQQYADSQGTAYTVTATPKDYVTGTTGPVNQAAWTVLPPVPPTITGLTNSFVTTAGATITSQPLPYTCATSNCIYTLAGAPSGIGLALTPNGIGQPSQTVLNNSGTLYAVGTVNSSVAPASTAYAADVKAQGASNYWRLDETSGSSGVDSLGGNTLIEQAGVGHGAPGAVLANSDTASTFDGSSVDGYAATQTAVTAPQTFSESVWFTTRTTSGGRLLGFSSQATGTSGGYDRQIYLDNTGHLFFGVCGNSCPTALTTSGSYNDGQWHQAVGTLSGAGMNLYVDGSLIATNASSTTAQAMTGFWRLGGDNLAAWPGSVSSQYFAGTLDDVSIYPSALTPAQIQQQYSDSGRVPFSVTATPVDLTSSVTGAVNTAAWQVDSPPTVTGLTSPFATTVGATVASQALAYNCPLSACTYALTGAPAGIGLSSTPGGAGSGSVSVSTPSGSVYLVGTVGAGVAPGTFTLTVTPTDTASGVRGPAATAAWTVYATPTVTGLPATFRTTAGATITAQPLTYSCPAGVCTITLAGAPSGIGLSTTATGPASSSVAVNATSGTVYVVGTVASGVPPGSFSLTVTPQDTASQINGPPVSSTWTVFAPPTITGLTASVRTTVGATVPSQTLSYSCPIAACTYTVGGGVTGIGLATSPTGAPAASVSVTGTSGTLYLVGAATSAGTFTLTVTGSSSGADGPAATAAWTVYPTPAITGLTSPFSVSQGATIAPQTLPYTCPTSSCSYTLAGAPGGIGLSTVPAGPGSAAVTVSSTSGNLYLVGTVSGTASGPYTVTVTPRDLVYGVTGTAATAAWTVNGATISGLINPFSTTVGATVSQPLTYTCPSLSCTYTVSGVPTGIGLDTDNVSPVANSVTVTGSSSGTVYLRGTVAGTVKPGTFTVVLTPRDALNNVSGAAVQATWTVYSAPTVNGLVTPFTTMAGAVLASQALPYTCPSSSCTYTLTGAPAGVGLNTDNGSSVSSRVTVTGSTSGNIYLRGTVAASTAPSSTAYAADVRSQGASDYWRLGEAAGTTGIDSIGSLPLTEQAGVGHGVGGAIASNSDTASTFDGLAADGAASTQTAITGPQTFAESVWFNTTTTSGGRLLGFSNSTPAHGISNNYDRQIYMDNAGHLFFGVCGSSCPVTLSTSGTYNDGQWHQATGMLSSAGLSFYVDGSLIGTNASITTAQVFNGYWRLGGDNLNGWPGTVTSRYFAGTIDDVSIYPTALTPTQIQQQYSDSGRVPFTPTVTPADTASGIQGAVNQAAWTVLSPPVVSGLTTPFTTTAGAVLTNQTLPYSCPGGSCTFALTGAPAGVGISTAGTGAVSTTATVTAVSGVLYLRGTVSSSASGGYPVALTPTDTASGVVGTAAQASWTVSGAPTASGLPTGIALSVGEVIPNVAVSYTCPAGSCTLALNAAAPAGIVLSTSTNTGTATSVTVTGTSGTVYVNGTIRGSATPGPYTVSVTPTDVNGVVGSASTATGTLYAAPTTGSPGTVTKASGLPISQAIAYSCPVGSCTIVLTNYPTGVGLSTTQNTLAPINGTTSINEGTGTGTFYIQGTPLLLLSRGTYAMTLTITDANGSSTTTSATWTIT